MYKLLYPAGAITIATIVLAAFSYQLPSVSDVVIVPKDQENVPATEETIDWETILKTVPSYFEDPEKEKAEQPVVQEVKRMPNEARLVAVVNVGNSGRSAGVFILPGEQEPQVIEQGDTWLAPWQLKTVNADSVVWLNGDDETELHQKLF